MSYWDDDLEAMKRREKFDTLISEKFLEGTKRVKSVDKVVWSIMTSKRGNRAFYFTLLVLQQAAKKTTPQKYEEYLTLIGIRNESDIKRALSFRFPKNGERPAMLSLVARHILLDAKLKPMTSNMDKYLRAFSVAGFIIIEKTGHNSETGFTLTRQWASIEAIYGAKP